MAHLNLNKILIALVLLVWGHAAFSHGGVSLENDRCIIKIGPHTAHFSGYQPKTRAGKEFCEDVPVVGNAVFVIDLLMPELRKMNVEFRILRDTSGKGYRTVYADLGSAKDIEAATIYHLPKEYYPRGTVLAEYDFSESGMYIGVVRANHPETSTEYISVFPFAVGITRYTQYLFPWGLGVLIGGPLLGLLAWRASRKNH
jgi:hypothetical protein